MNIISYSGGADSTAVLVYCRENSVPYEEVVYSEDWFPYPDPEFLEYFDYIEKEFDIKITRLPCDRRKWMDSEGAGHGPWMPHPYCCRVKSMIIANYLKEKYGDSGVTMILGIRRAESWKRKTYQEKDKWHWNKRFKVDYDQWFPIFRFIDSKHYCNIHGVKINPLYDIYGVRRLGCKICYKRGELRWKPIDEQQLELERWL